MDRTKKAVLLLTSYFMLLLSAKVMYKKKDIDPIINDNYQNNCVYPYAYYNDKCIYIGDEDQIELIKDDNDNNVYIIDERNDNNPSMSICNSYKIRNINEIKYILNVLIKYEEDNSSSWDRTYSSMKRKWLIHNICYYLNYERHRTQNVDLDNYDEDYYDKVFHVVLNSKEMADSEAYDEKEMTRSRSKNN